MELPGPTLNLANGLLASTPLLVLLVTLMSLKWSAPKAGVASWLAVLLVAWVFFGADYNLLAIRNIRAHPTDR